MSALLLRCPRCSELIPHPFARLMDFSNLGTRACPGCQAPLRFAGVVRRADLVCLAGFFACAIAMFVLLRLECDACRQLFARHSYSAPRLTIIVAGLAGLPAFFGIARRFYLGRMLRRGMEWELLEVFEG